MSDGRSRDPRHNRWFEAMDRHESTVTAVSLWAFHVVVSLLIVVAVLCAMSAALHLVGELGDGGGDRVRGAVALLASLGLFAFGRRLSDDVRIHPRSH